MLDSGLDPVPSTSLVQTEVSQTLPLPSGLVWTPDPSGHEGSGVQTIPGRVWLTTIYSCVCCGSLVHIAS